VYNQGSFWEQLVTPMTFVGTFYAQVTFKKHHIMANQRFQCFPCWFSTKICSIDVQLPPGHFPAIGVLQATLLLKHIRAPI
jgi:hypothetical protein